MKNKIIIIAILVLFSIGFAIQMPLNSSSSEIEESFQGALQAYDAGDYDSAKEIWTRLADKGSPGSQNNLGLMYENGVGVEQDYEKALKLYQLSAKQGYTEAQYNLGSLYHNGTGVKQDYEKAAKYYQLAADKNYNLALNNLGVFYNSAIGVEKDTKKAAKLFRKAAIRGHALSQNNLGLAFATGQGMKEDVISAYVWFDISLNNGEETAKSNHEYATSQMNEEQIIKAKKLAQICLNSNYENCP